jgi:hypothetical protein
LSMGSLKEVAGGTSGYLIAAAYVAIANVS